MLEYRLLTTRTAQLSPCKIPWPAWDQGPNCTTLMAKNALTPSISVFPELCLLHMAHSPCAEISAQLILTAVINLIIRKWNGLVSLLYGLMTVDTHGKQIKLRLKNDSWSSVRTGPWSSNSFVYLEVAINLWNGMTRARGPGHGAP